MKISTEVASTVSTTHWTEKVESKYNSTPSFGLNSAARLTRSGHDATASSSSKGKIDK